MAALSVSASRFQTFPILITQRTIDYPAMKPRVAAHGANVSSPQVEEDVVTKIM
jgi:hypothetical protein